MRTALRDLAQKPQRLECGFGPFFGQRIVRCRVGKTFAGTVHAGPQSVVVVVVLPHRTQISGMRQMDVAHKAVRGSAMVFVDHRLEQGRLFSQCRRAPFQTAHPVRRGEPRVAIFCDGHRTHIVVREPAMSLAIIPDRTVEADRTQPRPKPNHLPRSGGNRREVVVRQPLLPGVERPFLAVEASDAGRTGEPQAVLRVESDASHIARPPALHAVDGIRPLPVSRRLAKEQPLAGRHGDPPIGGNRHLPHVFVRAQQIVQRLDRSEPSSSRSRKVPIGCPAAPWPRPAASSTASDCSSSIECAAAGSATTFSDRLPLNQIAGHRRREKTSPPARGASNLTGPATDLTASICGRRTGPDLGMFRRI